MYFVVDAQLIKLLFCDIVFHFMLENALAISSFKLVINDKY